MSQFYSDMITWSLVGLTGGAVLLGHFSAPSDSEQGAPSGALIVAAADPGVTPTVTDAVPDAPLVAITANLPATPRPVALPQIIADADLISVNFTGTGGEPDLPQIDARVSGVVTGESVNLRAGPGTGFEIVSRAVRNDELIVTGERDGLWVQVLAPITEDEAWIHGNYFRMPDGV